jgi:hypothetical protein
MIPRTTPVSGAVIPVRGVFHQFVINELVQPSPAAEATQRENLLHALPAISQIRKRRSLQADKAFTV